jgi:hypothetical protein
VAGNVPRPAPVTQLTARRGRLRCQNRTPMSEALACAMWRQRWQESAAAFLRECFPEVFEQPGENSAVEIGEMVRVFDGVVA